MMKIITFAGRYLCLIPTFLFICMTQLSFAEITEKDIESVINGLKYLSADFIQINADSAGYSGHIYISKTKTPKIRIDYEKGVAQRIFIENDIIHTIDLSNNTETTDSLAQTPIYPILKHGFSLSKERYTIDQGDSKYAYCTVHQMTFWGETCIKLIFSKKDNGKLKYLEGWIIMEQNGNTVLFNLLPDNISINDCSKVPDSIFKR